MVRTKKKLTQEQKEHQIIKTVDSCRYRMGLSSWTIGVEFEHFHKDTIAYVESKPIYLDAKVTVNLKRVDELINDPTKLSHAIWHELEHVVDSPKNHVFTETIKVLQDANQKLAQAWWKSEDERITTQRTMLHDTYSK
jgi:hypothetical protein